MKGKSLSCVRPSGTPWTAAFQAPPSMGFLRQEYWSGVPLPSPCCSLGKCRLRLQRVIYGKVGESEVAQSCPTLCDPMDCSLSGSSVHEIFQARVLECVAISFSRGSSPPRGYNQGLPHCKQRILLYEPPGKFICGKFSSVQSLSRVRLFANPWTVANQAPPSMEFSRQEYWSVLPFPSPGSSQPRDRTRVSRIVSRRFTV